MSQQQSGALPPVVAHIDRPSVARVYNYLLGGDANWEVDRSFGDRVLETFPLARRIVLGDRLFLHRVVRHLVGECGIRQFLDVGCGVPSGGATHEIADGWAVGERRRPTARVTYVDNDPVAVAHAQQLLDREGDWRRHAVVHADLRDPEELWQRVLDTDLVDREQPIALLLIGVLHLKQLDAAGNELVWTSVSKLLGLLPRGSYLAISNVTNEDAPERVQTTLDGLKQAYGESGCGDVVWRSHADVQAAFEGCQMLAPGWISATAWRPEESGECASTVSLPPDEAVLWVGLGIKP